MSIIRGKNLVIALSSSAGATGANDIVVGCATDCTLNVTMNTLDVTSKDSPAAKEFITDDYEWTASANAFYDPAKTLNHEEILAYLVAGTLVWINVGVPGSSYPLTGSFQEGQAMVVSCNLTGAVGDTAKVSVELKGTGILTPKAYSTGGSMS